MENDRYKTKDIYEAAFLYARRIKLAGLDKLGNSYWFVFENKQEAETLSNGYWTRDADVCAKAYAEAVRSLKDMIFAQRD